jgi:3-oxoacyl-[acyl-carrier protein] reductase
MAARLSAKKALVTGGSSGIGKSIVALFAREGAHVACVASSDLAKARSVADEVGTTTGSIVPYVGDIGSWNGARGLVERVAQDFDGIDILVTAAGVFYPTPIGYSDPESVERMIDINLLGTIACIDAVVPHMKAQGGGKIVTVSSIAGIIGFGKYATYCATKAGIGGMVKALAIELAPHNINVNAIAPGNTETPINEDIRTKPELQAFYQTIKARTPTKRVYSKPEDMARAALYLSTDDSIAAHGSTMVLDEGFIAGI